MASALTPSLRSCSTSRSAPRLVRTNTSVFSELRQMAAHTFTRSIWCTSRKRCSMASTVVLGEATSCITGSVRYRLTSRSTAPSRVAENSRVWWLAFQPAQHPLDLGHEPHVGHTVGLVEHQGLDVGHRQLAPVAEVDEAARGGDDHVHAASQLLDLALDVGPAVDGGDPADRRLGQRARGPRSPGRPAPGWGPGPGPAGRPGPVDRAAMVRWSRGTPKARVLPEPVLALPHTSRPARASATVMAWMAKGRGDALGAEGLDQGGVDAQGGEGVRVAVLGRCGLVGLEDAIRGIDGGGHGVFRALSLVSR